MRSWVSIAWVAALSGVGACGSDSGSMPSGAGAGGIGGVGAGLVAPPSAGAAIGSPLAGTHATAGSLATGGTVASAGTFATAGTLGTAGTLATAGTSATAGTLATAGTSATAGRAGGSAGMNAAGGCGTESFAAIYRDIFANANTSCTAAPCHGRKTALEAVGNLDMSTPAITYSSLVGKTSDSMSCAGKPRVIAGNAQGSLLVRKLRDTTLDCGITMPAGNDPISDPDLQRIVTWINAGACNN